MVLLLCMLYMLKKEVPSMLKGKFYSLLAEIVRDWCIGDYRRFSKLYKDLKLSPKIGNKLIKLLEANDLIACKKARKYRRRCIPTLRGFNELLKNGEAYSDVVKQCEARDDTRRLIESLRLINYTDNGTIFEFMFMGIIGFIHSIADVIYEKALKDATSGIPKYKVLKSIEDNLYELWNNIIYFYFKNNEGLASSEDIERFNSFISIISKMMDTFANELIQSKLYDEFRKMVMKELEILKIGVDKA